jgi:L-alanine-DL-glutamate epimerase-like enolase superfamily enzyme
VDAPILADESRFSPADCIRLIQMEAVDCSNVKLAKCGGLVRNPIGAIPGREVAALPPGPGLGVEVDRAKVEQYRFR